MFTYQERQNYQKNKLSKRQEFHFSIRRKFIDQYMTQQRAKLVSENIHQQSPPQQTQFQRHKKENQDPEIVQKQLDAFLQGITVVVPAMVASDIKNIFNYQQTILSNQFQSKLDPLNVFNIRYMSKVLRKTKKMHSIFLENYFKAFKGQQGQKLISNIMNDQKQQNTKDFSINFCNASIDIFNSYLNNFLKMQQVHDSELEDPIFTVSFADVQTICQIASQFWNENIDVLVFAQMASSLCRLSKKEMQSRLMIILDSLMYEQPHFFIIEAVYYGILEFSLQNLMKIVLHPKFISLMSQGFQSDTICKIKAIMVVDQLLYHKNKDVNMVIIRQIELFGRLLVEEVSKQGNNDSLQKQLLECINAFGQIDNDKVVDFLLQINFGRWLGQLSSFELKMQLFCLIKNVLLTHIQNKQLFKRVIDQPELIKRIYEIKTNQSVYKEILLELAEILVQQFEANQVFASTDVIQQVILGLSGTDLEYQYIFERINNMYQSWHKKQDD